jgi:hypothetical protein
MADPEIWKALIDTGNPYVQQERQQKGLMGMMELQTKQREMESAQRLRDLYSSGQPVSTEKVMSIDPAFGQKMQQFQNEQLMQQYKMLESQGNIEEQRRKTQESKQHIFANTLGVGVENWIESLGGRQPTTQDIEAFKPKLGGMLKFVDETYGYKPDVAIDPYHPEQLLSTAESLGYASRRSKTAQEAQMRNLPPAWTPEQYRGTPSRVERNPVTQQPEMMPGSPGLRGGMPQGAAAGAILDQSTGESIAPTAENLPKLQKIYNEVSDPNEKKILGSVINSIKMSGGGVPPAGTTNVPEFRGQVTKAETEAKLSAEEEVADRKAVDSYLRSKPPEQVRNLIKESLAGDLETGLARLGKLVGVTTPGGAPTAALKVITQQLASTSPFAPGSQSDVEYKARLQKIGDPASDEPIENRLAALDEFYRDQESFVTQKWNPKSETEILDARKKGYISEDNALEVFRRFKKSKSGAM